MTVVVGDLVRTISVEHYAQGQVSVGSLHYVTMVHVDGLLELEGIAGRFMAKRFERVELAG